MKELVYGFPCVENPHDFTPDEESYIPQEIAFWKNAKLRWDAGELDVRGHRSGTVATADGGSIHTTRTSWGIGINMVDFSNDD